MTMRITLVLCMSAASTPCFFTVTDAFLSVSTSYQALRQEHQVFSLIADGANFDFSSQRAWDDYYRQADSNVTLEWHASVPFSVQINLIPRGSSCLMVGCGNSAFSSILYNAHQGETRITCLDSSSTCLDQLQNLYSKTCPNMTFLCGDAITLSNTLQQDATLPQHYNVIYDKGLTDAILCDEGWDGPLEQLLREVSTVLTSGGIYILICYRLSRSQIEFLEEIGTKVGLSWSFDVEGTNDGVSVSISTKG